MLGINLNPAQKRWFRLICKIDKDGQPEWANKLVVHVAANQIGKTLGLAVIILWACWNKIGLDRELPPERFHNSPFAWFHLAPTQQQSYLVLRDMRALIKGEHPAQKRDCRIPLGMIYDQKVEQVYDGLGFFNNSVVQFRTTDDQGKALQGRRAAGISYDEAAFEGHLKSVINEVLMMRLVSTGGPLLLVSTPNGINDFFEVSQSIRDSGVEREPRCWTTRDGRALVISHISDNVGYGLTTADVDRMERDLDPATREQQLRGAFLEPLEAFFVPQDNIMTAFVDLPDVQEPTPGHVYVAFWDPSVDADPTCGIVIDVTPQPMQGVYFAHYPKPLTVNNLIFEIKRLHVFYGSAFDTKTKVKSSIITGFDATSMGGGILKQMLADMRPSRPINFAGANHMKMDALTNLRAAMSTGRLVFPKSWTRMEREILNYRVKDKMIKQDAVMAAAGAAHIAIKGFSGKTRAVFSPSGAMTPRIW